MGRVAGVLVLATFLSAGCTTVRLAQRDGCWVKQTEGFSKNVQEEIGPCARPEPKWSQDRVTRLVQECVAAADYRWQSEALAAWNKGQPIPKQTSEQTVMEQCMGHDSTTLVRENEALRARVAELDVERRKLEAVAQGEREHLRATEGRMADALGEAAKKPAPSAFATANSTGTASNQSEQATPAPAAEPKRAAGISVPLSRLVDAEQTSPAPKARAAPVTSCAPAAKKSKAGTGAATCTPSVGIPGSR